MSKLIRFALLSVALGAAFVGLVLAYDQLTAPPPSSYEPVRAESAIDADHRYTLVFESRSGTAGVMELSFANEGVPLHESELPLAADGDGGPEISNE